MFLRGWDLSQRVTSFSEGEFTLCLKKVKSFTLDPGERFGITRTPVDTPGGNANPLKIVGYTFNPKPSTINHKP